MSNSIWKMPDQKPTSGKWICIFDGFDYQFDNPNPDCWDDMFVEKWCYLDDLIAQADKAERLGRAVQYLKRLHIATIEKYNPKEKELAEQTIDYAIEMALEQESNN